MKYVTIGLDDETLESWNSVASDLDFDGELDELVMFAVYCLEPEPEHEADRKHEVDVRISKTWCEVDTYIKELMGKEDTNPERAEVDDRIWKLWFALDEYVGAGQATKTDEEG